MARCLQLCRSVMSTVARFARCWRGTALPSSDRMPNLGAMKVDLPVEAIDALMKSNSMNYISPDVKVESLGSRHCRQREPIRFAMRRACSPVCWARKPSMARVSALRYWIPDWTQATMHLRSDRPNQVQQRLHREKTSRTPIRTVMVRHVAGSAAAGVISTVAAQHIRAWRRRLNSLTCAS